MGVWWSITPTAEFPEPEILLYGLRISSAAARTASPRKGEAIECTRAIPLPRGKNLDSGAVAAELGFDFVETFEHALMQMWTR